jgi:hypothetical protein
LDILQLHDYQRYDIYFSSVLAFGELGGIVPGVLLDPEKSGCGFEGKKWKGYNITVQFYNEGKRSSINTSIRQGRVQLSGTG